MASIYVSIGSNLDPERMVYRAIQSLRNHFGPLDCSPVYRSAAVGFDGAPFLNLVCRFSSELTVTDVDRCLHRLEDQHGRRRDGPRFSSRTLDLDLLLYDDLCISEGRLKLPRDEITLYAFVLRPLADLAPMLKHPLNGESIADLWRDFDASEQPLESLAFNLDPPDTA